MERKATERINHLDLYRAFAILAVIAIHGTSIYAAKVPKDSLFYPVYFFINKGSMFAVPAFLFLSALVLFYNYYPRERNSWSGFWRKRMKFVLVPYFLWSLFYFLLLQIGINRSLTFDAFIGFGKKLLLGTNYTHLYFIFVIAQFYVLFPLMLALVKKVPAIARHLIATGIVVQIAFVFLNRSVLHITTTGRLVITYTLFLCLGAYIGMNYRKYIDKLYANRWPWIVAWAVSGVVFLTYLWLMDHGITWKSDLNGYLYNVLYYGYVSLSCIALLLISSALHAKRGRLVTLLQSIGIGSFAIYFVHPVFLLVWRRYIQQTGDVILFHLLTAAGAIAALTLSWFMYLAIRKLKWAWLLTGK
ncbi:MAG TPA: acyltransferase [Bacilli bacterium]